MSASQTTTRTNRQTDERTDKQTSENPNPALQIRTHLSHVKNSFETDLTTSCYTARASSIILRPLDADHRTTLLPQKSWFSRSALTTRVVPQLPQ